MNIKDLSVLAHRFERCALVKRGTSLARREGRSCCPWRCRSTVVARECAPSRDAQPNWWTLHQQFNLFGPSTNVVMTMSRVHEIADNAQEIVQGLHQLLTPSHQSHSPALIRGCHPLQGCGWDRSQLRTSGHRHGGAHSAFLSRPTRPCWGLPASLATRHCN